MKAASIGPQFGNENLKIVDRVKPSPGKDEVLIRISKGGLNPVDYNLINGKIIYNVDPIPHVPGTEVIGTAVTDGHFFRKGDKVIVYNRVFDGYCEECRSNREHLCRNGGIWGIVTDGGYQEYVSVPEQNLFRLEDFLTDEVAASFPVAGLTAYHALQRVNARAGESILVYGASGNTGLFLVQLAKILGLYVYGVSRNGWIKPFGCDEVYDAEKIPEDLMVDIVVNSLGSKFWDSSIQHLSLSGRLVTFGMQTGKDASIDISRTYSREVSIVGSTGGTRKDLKELIAIAGEHTLKVRKYKEYKLESLSSALVDFQKKHDGRIFIDLEE